MSDAVQQLKQLCQALQPLNDPADRAQLADELASADDGLTGLVALASEQLLTPALYHALRSKNLLDGLPEDLQTYLTEIHALNVKRNGQLKSQVLETATALNAIGVEPVLLKGAVNLFDPAFDDPGGRMMADIDMLVPMASIQDCIEALRSIGYAEEDTEWTYHYPPMGRPGDVAPVELHAQVGEQRSVLLADEALTESIELPAVSGVRLRALSPTHQTWHNIFHSQVQDRHHVLRVLPVRQLYDFTGLLDRLDGRIDWHEIATRMQAHGLRKPLAAHLYQANKLFGVPIASEELERVANAPATKRHFRRCLMQIRWPGLGSLTRGLGTLSHPFKKYNIELIYGPADSRFALYRNRVRHAFRLLKKHRWRSFARIGLHKENHYPSP